MSSAVHVVKPTVAEKREELRVVVPYARLMSPSGGELDGAVLSDDWIPNWKFTREHGIALLRRIEFAARISHRSEDAVTEDSWQRFLRSVVLGHGDWSVTEHGAASVDFLIDRGVSHELVRHRHLSYTQESTRFVNYQKKRPPSFVFPDGDTGPHSAWSQAIEQAKASYTELLADGWSPQLARSVLPNALASRLVVSGNLRAWRHFLLMRTSRECHPAMLQVTLPLLDEFKEKIPLLFDDIEPRAPQVENLKKPQ